jgi:hypothetical protein
MPSFRIMVPNGDEGEDLGEYESDYLPRVGDWLTLSHPRVSGRRGDPFCAVVESVRHEARCGEPGEHGLRKVGTVTTTVWLVEEQAAPTLYCDCAPEVRERHGATGGVCNSCGSER